jgi:exosortase H (IPTLxxWG-CTERM-specific)
MQLGSGAESSVTLSGASAKAGSRFVLHFFLFATAGFALMFAPPIELCIRNLTYAVTAVAGALIHLAGGKVWVTGDVMAIPTSGFTLKVVDGCNGVNVIVLLWSAMLAWPASLTAKIKGLTLGALTIQAVNTLRIITLFYVGQWNRDWFEWLHVYVWEVIIMILGLLVFAVWIRRATGSAASAPAR